MGGKPTHASVLRDAASRCVATNHVWNREFGVEVPIGGRGTTPGMEWNHGDRFMANSVVGEADALLVGGRLWQESLIGSFAELINEATIGPTGATIEACRPVSGTACVRLAVRDEMAGKFEETPICTASSQPTKQTYPISSTKNNATPGAIPPILHFRFQ